jgi:signal transduction histidine kinase
MKKVLILCLLTLFVFTQTRLNLHAQAYALSNAYTTKEGLPSNHIYEILEDKEGFLWICTDNGVSRFDGKYFKNFSVKNGLPSYDAIQIAMEDNGKIWVNCFLQKPAYFDKAKQKFITLNDKEFKAETQKYPLFFSGLADGAVEFKSTAEQWKTKNGKIIENKKLSKAKFQLVSKVPYPIYYAFDLEKKSNTYKNTLIIRKNDGTEFAVPLKAKSFYSQKKVSSDKIYMTFLKEKLIIISGFYEKNIWQKEIIFEEPANNIKIEKELIFVYGQSGTIYAYENQTFKLLNKINTGLPLVNNSYFDSKKNFWVASVENGLQCFKNEGIVNYVRADNLHKQNFMSINVLPNGDFYAGNRKGQILSKNNGKYTTAQVGRPSDWMRSILVSENQMAAITEHGVSFNLTKLDILFSNIFHSIKSGIWHDKNTFILGTSRGLYGYNVRNKKLIGLNSPRLRTTKILKLADLYYYISANGLYAYNYKKNTSETISFDGEYKNIKVSNMVQGPNNTLWLSTENGTLLVLQNKKILSVIKNEFLTENINCLTQIGNNIWVGGQSGIWVIEPSFQAKFRFKVFKLLNDTGLPSNIVNDMSASKDSVYCATGNGIAILSKNIKLQNYQIKPVLTSVKFLDQELGVRSTYMLENDQKYIVLEFAGIDLGGHFNGLEYAFNDDTNWHKMPSNFLNLKLNNGKQTLKIRTLDINNNLSTEQLSLVFTVNTPFYNSLLFWLLVGILISGLIFAVYNRQKQRKIKAEFDQILALEIQRNKISADLHDDIGSTLSSLQLNSAVANNLMQRNPKEAQGILTKIEAQSKQLAEKMGDLIWSMKPGKDEFIDFGSRIKNFANDILSSSAINYDIKIDKALNVHLTDINIRKNLIAIAKEAINNAAKYSKANNVSLSCYFIKNTIILHIKDDGVGFDLAKAKGNGLKNMENRVKELSGTFSIITEPNAGCDILAEIPLSLNLGTKS